MGPETLRRSNPMDMADPKTWPPGAMFTFNFSHAISTIYKSLDPGFVDTKWLPTLQKLCQTWTVASDPFTSDKQSLLFIQLVYLDELWKILFGIAGPESPWLSMRNTVQQRGLNGDNDRMLAAPSFFADAIKFTASDHLITFLGRGMRLHNEPIAMSSIAEISPHHPGAGPSSIMHTHSKKADELSDIYSDNEGKHGQDYQFKTEPPSAKRQRRAKNPFS
ncbi:hypothetical protein SCUP234_10672 [Seiridium cupressi]